MNRQPALNAVQNIAKSATKIPQISRFAICNIKMAISENIAEI